MKYLFGIAAIFVSASTMHLSKDEEPKIAQFVRDMWAECDLDQNDVVDRLDELKCTQKFIDKKNGKEASSNEK